MSTPPSISVTRFPTPISLRGCRLRPRFRFEWALLNHGGRDGLTYSVRRMGNRRSARWQRRRADRQARAQGLWRLAEPWAGLGRRPRRRSAVLAARPVPRSRQCADLAERRCRRRHRLVYRASRALAMAALEGIVVKALPPVQELPRKG